VVGQVIDRLKRLGIYDDAMIVVVADHGESFTTKPTPAGPFVPGHLGYRRAVTRKNLADIASIPMFIKYPKGHGPAGVDQRFVRDLDILPTIAHTLGVPLAPVAGRSLQQRGYHGHAEVAVAATFDGTVRMGVGQWQRERGASLKRRLDLFGSGAHNVFAWGADAKLVGRLATDFEGYAASGTHATIDGAGRLRDVNPDSRVCLCQLAGRILGTHPEGMRLAIAINGRIAATGEGFADRGAKRLNWSVLVPPTAYRQGPNTVTVYRLGGGRLARIGP
jgi:hypothetical protein